MALDTVIASGGAVTEPIAIVGCGCNLPGGISTLEELFVALRDGRHCVTEVPFDRWDTDAYYDSDPLTPGKSYVRHGGFVSDIDCFDAAFFGISDVEASRMDPQQRMALQTVWHTLENAGQSAEELLHSNTGVFLAMMNTNGYLQLKGEFEGVEGITAYDSTGDAMSITAGRISHFLGLEGPCFAVDTACSGSMVAVHLARQSILAGDCDSAIVLGVNAILHPTIHIAFSKVGLMSRSGQCRAFDKAADGYVRGEGCVAVLLRRQSLAIARGDHILARIIGTAINQDGRTSALTAPNVHMQEKVIRLALARVGASSNEVGYVEAHGTGTTVGDPTEMSALVNVYGLERSQQDPLYVGSVKTNFGHLESAAGLLGLVKAALSLDREKIFPSLHFTHLNPNIDLCHAPISVPTAAIAWPRGERPRLAGVNSFSYSGTNAHAVLQEAPCPGDGYESASGRSAELVVLSAKSAITLQDLADRWTAFMQEDTLTPLSDIAFTAATGRSHMRHRVAVVGRDKDDVKKKIEAWRAGHISMGLVAGQVKPGRIPRVAFVFTGQGAQYSGMGRQLYETEAPFKAAIDRCAALMDSPLGVPLLDVLFGKAATELLGDTRYVQPALFAVEYALTELLRQWGIEPSVVMGHSVGEIVAACVAGVLDVEGAVRFVVARGRLMGELPRVGKMLAVDATPEEARGWIAGKEMEVSVAAVNGSHSIIISGRDSVVDDVAGMVRAQGRRAIELKVSHAFHSPLMDPILKELGHVAASLQTAPARIPVISNLTGAIMDTPVDPQYWASHARQPVLFHQGMADIIRRGCSIVVEVGPHPTLLAASTGLDTTKTRCMTTLMRDGADVQHIFETLGSLFASGVSVNFNRVFWESYYRRVPLPLYPFRRDRHWLGKNITVDIPPKVPPNLHPMLGRAVSIGFRKAVFESSISATHPWTDHRVLGVTVFPGSGYLEMAARGYAAFRGRDWRSVVLRNVQFERPLILGYRAAKKVNLSLEYAPDIGEAAFSVHAEVNGNKEIYCRGRISASEDINLTVMKADLDRMVSQLGIGTFYGELRKAGLEYGANFSTVRQLRIGPQGSGEAIGRITSSPYEEETDTHPFTLTTMLDGCMQVCGAAFQSLENTDLRGTFIPASIQSVTIYRPLLPQVWSHAIVRTNADGQAALACIRVLSGEGELLIDLDGLELRIKVSLTGREDHDSVQDQGNTAKRTAWESRRDDLVSLLRPLPYDKRLLVVAEWLTTEVMDTLGQAAEDLDIKELDPSRAFIEIGLDSLLVTELQRRIQERLDFRFRPMEALDYQSIDSLAQFILENVLVIEPVDAASKVETSAD